MKHFMKFAALASVLIFAACGALAQASDDTPTAIVEKAVNEHELNFVVNYVSPSGFPGYASSDGYYLKIKDGKVSSYLPFVGTSTQPAFGGDEVGFKFDECPVKIKTKKGKDSTTLRFSAKSGYEKVDVIMEIWSNGNANLSCVSPSRSVMNYSGELQ